MCGIFGFLAATNGGGRASERGFFDAVEEMLGFAVSPEGPRPEDWTDEAKSRILAAADRARGESYGWVTPGGFLAVLSDAALRARLANLASSLSAWIVRLERVGAKAGLKRQSDWEFFNRLLVGAKDILWQLERDLLANLDSVSSLLEDGASPASLEHAWQLNLLARSLDRLEVRGRDSAGIAVYAHFRDAAALQGFLRSGDLGGEVELRGGLASLTHGSIVRPASSPAALLFVFKVANEVGKMGDNVVDLRAAIRADRCFQAALREPGVSIQCLAHTRWASNGIISLPNCHPVDGALVDPRTGAVRGSGELVAVLNGDVDNYLELVERYVRREGLAIESDITTDAKIIPIVVSSHYRSCGDLPEAFRRAFAEFEGSMAIGVMSADRPGEFLFGQKGSGQGLYFGLAGGSVAVASEMYGIVEFTPQHAKAEGERVEGGEVFHLDSRGGAVDISLIGSGGRTPLPPARIRKAEITTRDINRGAHPHFFIKEITESVESVRKTLRGKFEVAGDTVRFLLGGEVIGEDLLERLRSGRIHRIICLGQGTAAIAAQGIAWLLERALARAPRSVHVLALKATELSGHYLTEDMSDVMVVAVSQSGTTTDTNRTVDMARARGAWILGIVNRRNSDLVYKSDGVLYTSDGRDIEMSVASTKAFYAQNVAGQVLALALASELGTLDPAELAREVRALESLPGLMARTLERSGEVEAIARRFAVERRHWAVVGSGPGKIAADEIRIKLSELCYKSIAVDFLEDKKHIDLSSEPLVLVCANGVPEANVSDLVKEVAIFKAHKSLPLVIVDEGETRFDPYAAGTVRVPQAGCLAYLLAAMVGHLFGYHAAAAVDALADRLRRIRADLVASPHRGEDSSVLGPPPPELMERILEVEGLLLARKFDAALDASTSVRLHSALESMLGRLAPRALAKQAPTLMDAVLAGLSEAIAQLSRPIDAIKHQAKTVTVGISRSEAPRREGPLFEAIRGFQIASEELSEPNRRFLAAFEPLVAAVEGATLYRVEGLDPLGRPTETSTLKTLRRIGCAASLSSRGDDGTPLAGTKWGVVNDGETYVGYGKNDARKIVIVPVVGERSFGHIVLFHLEPVPMGRRAERLKALRAWPRRFERLKMAVTERNVPWSDELIDFVSNEVLFFAGSETAAEAILEHCGSARTR